LSPLLLGSDGPLYHKPADGEGLTELHFDFGIQPPRIDSGMGSPVVIHDVAFPDFAQFQRRLEADALVGEHDSHDFELRAEGHVPDGNVSAGGPDAHRDLAAGQEGGRATGGRHDRRFREYLYRPRFAQLPEERQTGRIDLRDSR
jgi:hypothetical protein